MKTVLQFTITPAPINFGVDLVAFQPATDIGKGWKFADEVNGPADNDGIAAFKEAIVEASKLPKEQGYQLLLADGLSEGKTAITGDEKIKALVSRKLADPDLLWSLFKEGGQKTLRYLHDTYGVVWMEALRRVLCCPSGLRVSLYLYREGDGSWSWYCRWLVRRRSAYRPALVLDPPAPKKTEADYNPISGKFGP